MGDRSGLVTRRRRLTLGLIGVLLAVCVAAVGGWWTAAGAAGGRVSATWSPRCGSGILDVSGDEPVIRSRPGWRCDVSLTIANHSDRRVRVSHLELPVMGSGGGAEVTAYSTGAVRIYDVDEAPQSTFGLFGGGDRTGNDIDAVAIVDTVIPPHSSRTVSLALGRNPHGCNTAGTFYIDGWPTIVFHVMHRTFRYEPDQRLLLRTYRDALDATNCDLD